MTHDEIAAVEREARKRFLDWPYDDHVKPLIRKLLAALVALREENARCRLLAQPVTDEPNQDWD